MKPPGWKSAIPGAAVGFFFSNSQFIYTFYKFCANNFIIPDQTGAYNILSVFADPYFTPPAIVMHSLKGII